MEGLDPVYREYALRLGRLLLCWAGLEDESGTRLADEDKAEAFVDAIGASSIPDAAATVAESLSES